MSNDKCIKVPIKDMILNAIEKNNCEYEEISIDFLRAYFVAGLNLGFIDIYDLDTLIGRFASRIKRILIIHENLSENSVKDSCQIIRESILMISEKTDEKAIDFFKAITEVLFRSENKKYGTVFRTVISEIVAERIENMHMNNSRIIMPAIDNEVIGNSHLTIRAGYQKYNLFITLLKQFLIMMDFNENLIIRRAFDEGIDKVYDEIIENEDSMLLMNTIYNLYTDRVENNQYSANEIKLIEGYQLFVNSLFKKTNRSYYAFLALVTTDSLRKKCMSDKY